MMRLLAPCLLVAAAAAALSSCAHRSGYHASYFETPEAAEVVEGLMLPIASVEGGAAVVMSREAESAITRAKPVSFTGSVTQVAVPVARIVKEAAAASFAAVMTEGATTTSEAPASARGDYVVAPSVTLFSYSYDLDGGLITPRVSLGIRLRAVDAAGNVILDREYHEADFGYGGYASSAPPQEHVNRTLHLLARKLTAQAASDFAAEVAARGR